MQRPLGREKSLIVFPVKFPLAAKWVSLGMFAGHSPIEDFWQCSGQDWQPKELRNPEVVTVLSGPQGS